TTRIKLLFNGWHLLLAETSRQGGAPTGKILYLCDYRVQEGLLILCYKEGIAVGKFSQPM
ncbi:hypothetical protein, partial [Klebsiella pneumoniae]|uniref:hypothetical protein n=1 Tax=Klebsiella pneumoniae TaxID=573 RepID=UPI001D0DDE58